MQPKLKTLTGWLLAVICLVILTCTGCKTTPAGGGDPVYDATKTEQFKQAITPVAVSGVRRVLLKNPQTVPYFEAVVEVFSTARDTKNWDPYLVSQALDNRFSPLFPADKEWKQAVLDVKNAVMAIYAIFYADRFQAQMSEEKWAYHLTDVIARVFEQSIKEATSNGGNSEAQAQTNACNMALSPLASG